MPQIALRRARRPTAPQLAARLPLETTAKSTRAFSAYAAEGAATCPPPNRNPARRTPSSGNHREEHAGVLCLRRGERCDVLATQGNKLPVYEVCNPFSYLLSPMSGCRPSRIFHFCFICPPRLQLFILLLRFSLFVVMQ
jgi:hypothetical protein